MKYLITMITALLCCQVTWASQSCQNSEGLTSAELVGKVEAIADELEANTHKQRIMNMVYNRARVIRKQLNRYLNRVPRLRDADDNDIMALLEDIVVQLEATKHRYRKLRRVNKHLNKMLYKLEENREAPVEIAVLTINDSDPFYMGALSTTTKSTVSFIITNSGNGEAAILGESGLNHPFDFFQGGGYPGFGGTCGSVIPAGASCEIVLEFAPSAVGFYQDQLIIDYNDGETQQTVTKELTGEGV